MCGRYLKHVQRSLSSYRMSASSAPAEASFPYKTQTQHHQSLGAIFRAKSLASASSTSSPFLRPLVFGRSPATSSSILSSSTISSVSSMSRCGGSSLLLGHSDLHCRSLGYPPNHHIHHHHHHIQRRAKATIVKPPHQVLGIEKNCSDEDMKKAFRKLAQTYHPDTPTGDAKKFKEINAAYSLMKAQRRKGTADDADEKYGQAASGTRKYTRHSTSAQDHEREETPFDIAESLSLIDMCIIGIFTAVYFCGRALHYQRRKYEAKARQTLLHKFESEGMPSTPISQNVREGTAEFKESQLKKRRGNTLTRFADMREYFLVYDTNASRRRVETMKLGSEFIEEEEVLSACPIVAHIDALLDYDAYKRILPALANEVKSVPWQSVDTSPAVTTLLDGAARVTGADPNNHRLTIYEYRDEEEKDVFAKGGAAAALVPGTLVAPRCVLAVVNDRFKSSDMTCRNQRLIVSGKTTLQPMLAAERLVALKDGHLRVEDLAVGKPVPIRDLGEYMDNTKRHVRETR